MIPADTPQIRGRIDDTLKKFQAHQLYSGRSGTVVKSRRQAIAIALAQARRDGLLSLPESPSSIQTTSPYH